MESYKSNKVAINCDAATVYAKLSNPEAFSARITENLDKLPEEARKNFEKVKFTADGITIESPMGPVKLAYAERVPNSRIVLTAAQSPVAFNAVINLEQVDDANCSAVTELNVDIPVFLRPMVGNKLAEGATKFGEMLAKIPYHML